MKKFTLSLLLFTITFCTLIGLISNINIKAAETNDNFTVSMVDGAQIRTVEPNGIKFIGKVTGTVTGNDVKYGIVFGQGTVTDLTHETEDRAFAEVTSTTEDGEFYVTMIKFPESAYTMNITARAYVKVDGVYYYSDLSVTRNLGDLAVAYSKTDGYVAEKNPLIEEILKVLKETDTRIHITCLEDLEKLRDDVNNGNTYEGEIVVLDADLDLDGSADNNWLPIGGNSTPNGRSKAYFAGTFDGQGHTISNLYAHAGNDVGLFGCVGLGADKKGGIVNLTLKNVDIEGGARVGAFVGTMHNTQDKSDTFYFDNLMLTGDVKISGGNRMVGGMFGVLCNSGLSNLTINANEGSYVTNRADYGSSFELGGIAGEMNFGTENRTYKNIKSNLDVIGNTYSAGGLFGRCNRDGVVLENCEMTGDVTLNKATDQGDGWCRAGGLIASPNGSNIVVKNSSFTGTLKAFTADGAEMTKPEGLNPAFGKVNSGVTVE